MEKLVILLAVAISLNASDTPQCNKCYDEILESTKGVNILKSGKDFYDATLISLGFIMGSCVTHERREKENISVDCNALHSAFSEFRDELVRQAQNRGE